MGKLYLYLTMALQLGCPADRGSPPTKSSGQNS